MYSLLIYHIPRVTLLSFHKFRVEYTVDHSGDADGSIATSQAFICDIPTNGNETSLEHTLLPTLRVTLTVQEQEI